MPLVLQGYYAILDVKGSSLDLSAAMAHASELLAAEPCCLQLRGKELSPAHLCQLGHGLRSLCRDRRIPLCINDRMDVALAVRADAVHLGQKDLPLADALRVRKAARAFRLAIGISTHDLAESKAAEAGGADYVGLAPIFPTRSKADAGAASGLAMLARVSRALRIPVVAIGGVTVDNAAAVAAAGATAAAVIAGVDEAADRTQAGRRIAAAFASISRP
ncbi:MAG: thiamine phosphate synthase [Deltaproteobacteria bacterium]|nr:thiamine phosphate synthase [Deltaproteobacteria bacterium]